MVPSADAAVQAAGLRAETAVPAASAYHGRQVAKPGNAHTVSPVHEYLELRAGLFVYIPDLGKAQLPGKHHSLKTHVQQHLYAFSVMGCHLGGSVHA